MENQGVPVRVGLMKDGIIGITGKPSEVLTVENIKDTYSINSVIVSNEGLKAVLPVNTFKQ